MKTRLTPLLAGVLATLTASASTNLLPRLIYRDPPAKLQGSLVFLYSHRGLWASDAQIYEFSLPQKTLHLITESPGGYFGAAKDGQTFCVRYGVVNGFGLFITNAFIYSKRLHQARLCAFVNSPQFVTFAQDCVLFHFGRSITEYDISTEKLTSRPDDRMERVIKAVKSSDIPDNFGAVGFTAGDGRWVFFEEGGSAFEGTRLVSSPLNEVDTHFYDPKGKNTQILKRFPRPLKGSNHLHQMSPLGDYALIRRTFPIGDSWANTYYIVNTASGKSHRLLDEEVSKDGNAHISQLYWVGQMTETP